MSIIDSFFTYLALVDDFFWSHIGFTLVILLGLYFSIKTRFFQFRTLFKLRQTVRDLQKESGQENTGVSPLRLYFASVGGIVGLGNVVAVIMALLIGGPGALFWLWIAAIFGMLIKYAEIYLGVKFRVPNNKGGYDGGPMYYLSQAFKPKIIPYISAVLLCIYGVEVYQFLVITDTMVSTFHFQRELTIIFLIGLIVYTVLGGINRIANICAVLMPIFLVTYVSMSMWIIFSNASLLPDALYSVFYSAFNGHAALGGFAGSSMVLAAQSGIARAVYSGDIGIGYDSTLQSETRSTHPERQARMAIFALATDSFICTMSIMIVLITGLWQTAPGLLPSEYVATVLSNYFPHMNYFMTVFFFLAGFTTIIAFFAVGMKCARFISAKWGEKIYMLYAILAFGIFSFYDQSTVMLIMSVSGGLLMLLNLAAIAKLRHHIEFK